MSKNNKSRSGNPSVRAQARLASASDFKKKAGKVTVLELPSGSFVKARNPGGMKVFMQEGVIPNRLMRVIQESLDTGKEPDMDKAMKDANGDVDTKMIADIMALNDVAVIRCLVEPRVYPIPENEADRDNDLLYVDEIEDEDKMFIFNWVVSGTDDVERFRKELTSSLESMGAIKEVGDASESTPSD